MFWRLYLLQIGKTASGSLIRQEIIDLAPKLGRSGARPSSGGEEINVTEAVRRFKIDGATLRRLGEGSLAFIGRFAPHRGGTVYDADKLAASVQAFRGGVLPDTCEALTGIPAYAMADLVTEGLLKKVVDHDANLLAGKGPLIERKSIENLCRRLIEGKDWEITESQPLRQAMVGHIHPKAWSFVIAQLLNQRISFQVIAADQLLVDAINVSSQHITAAMAQFKAQEPDGVVSSRTASRLLGKSEQSIRAAIRKGILPAERRRSGLMIELRHLSAFSGTNDKGSAEAALDEPKFSRLTNFPNAN